MANEVTIVFTAKNVQTILNEGGSSAWRLDRNHARQCTYAVCTRNAHADWVEGNEPHKSAFIAGKVSDVVPMGDRFLITFGEYALLDVAEVWKGDRNPVRYASADDLGIDFEKLDWKPMPEMSSHTKGGHAPSDKSNTEARPLTMAEAKKGLALTFGVAPDAIEITIRG